MAEVHPFVVAWLEEQLESSDSVRSPEPSVEAAMRRALQLLQTTSAPDRVEGTLPTASDIASALGQLSAADVAVHLLDGSSHHFPPQATLQVPKMSEIG
jgi:hypothetical protein